MLKNKKIVLGGVLVVLIFFISTFTKNWGTAVTGNLVEKYKPEVKLLKKNPEAAIQKCPVIIHKLETGMPELAKNKDPIQIQIAYKLIADCSFASKNYEKSIEYYKKLSVYEPDYPRWHALVAESFMNMGKYGDALHFSVLATQLEPASFEFKRLNARVLAKLKLTNRAIDAYVQAIKIAPYDDIEPTKRELEKFVEDNNVFDGLKLNKGLAGS